MSSSATKAGRAGNAGDLAEWYAAQYRAAVGLAEAEGGARFRKLAESFPARNASGGPPYPLTGRQRMSNFLSLRLRYPLGPAGYDCLALTAQLGAHEAHYGYVYWRRGSERERGASEDRSGDPEYICVSPTFDSRDGEYRRRFIRYPVFVEACGRALELLSPYEQAALDMAGGGRLVLGVIAYPEGPAEALIRWAAEARLLVNAFAVALALDLFETRRGMLMAHTSASYSGLLREVAEARPSLVEHSALVSQMLEDPLTWFRRGSANEFAAQCGQKLVPMFVREVTQVADYNLAAWRELAVARLASDLVLNYVAPGFPLYNQWTYVEGADASLFENSAMEDRYARGQAVAEAARSLREARRLLGAEAAARENYHAGELGAQLYESLEYAQSYLLTSQVALLHTMEDVGWALRSLGAYVRRAPVQWPAATEVFAEADSAARLLFEYAYGAHCLHAKLGVAHTDLHGNNLTYYMWGLADRALPTAGGVAYEPYYEDPLVAYVAGPRGEADTYVFPAAGSSGCLIDFSRCVLGPGFAPRLAAGRSPQYAPNYYRDQVNRVMRALHRYAPAYVEKHQAALKAAVLANFEAAFPVLCAVDFIAIGRSVAAYLAEAARPEEGEARPFSVAPAARELAARLEAAAREVYITGLHDLAESAGARQQMRVPPFPGPALFERVFGEWRFARWAARDPRRLKAASLVDAYRFDNELRWGGADYADWPPWARLDEIEKHLGELKITALFERGVEPFLEALQPDARVEVIAEQLRAEQESLDGPPVSAASSWIGE